MQRFKRVPRRVRDGLLCFLATIWFLGFLFVGAPGAQDVAPQKCVTVETLARLDDGQIELPAQEASIYLDALGISVAQLETIVMWPHDIAVVVFGTHHGCITWRLMVPMKAHFEALRSTSGRRS